MTSRVAIYGYCGWMATLTVAFFGIPTTQVVVAAVLSLSATAAIATGVARNRPPRPGAWLSLAAAVALAGLARLVYDLLPGLEGEIKPGSFVAYPIYLTTFALFVIGLVALVPPRGVTDWAELLDLTILALGIGLLAGIFIIIPLGGSDAARQVGGLVPALLPVGDVLVLTAALRFALTVRRMLPAALVIISMLAITAGNVTFWFGFINNTWLWGEPNEIFWMVALTALGVAALHPSMSLVRAMPDVPYRLRDTSTGRLALLAVGSLVPPAVMMTEALHGQVFGPVLVAVSALMLVLVLARLASVAYRLRRHTVREHGLQEAIVDLVAATDAGAVRDCLDRAVGRLLPARAWYRVALVTPEVDQSWLRRTNLVEPTKLAASEFPQTVTALNGVPTALAYPLRHHPRGDTGGAVGSDGSDGSDGRPPDAALLVAADDSRLASLRPLQAFAAAATLALARIRLDREVIRNASDRYFRTLVHNASDVILVLDDAGRVRYASPSAASLFGEREVIGATVPDLISGGSEAARVPDLRLPTDPTGACAALSEGGDWTVRDGAGGLASVEITCRDLSRDPSIHGRVLTLHDVTSQRRLERELTRQAFHDPLTGLPNRALFSHRVRDALEHDQSVGTVTGVLLIDLDEFKMVNDALGHETGDAYLVSVGERLVKVADRRGVAARLGGDEFAMLVTDAADLAAVHDTAARVVEELHEPVRLADQQVACGASVGVSASSNGWTSQQLMHQADLALYNAKEAGRGCWRAYEPTMHSSILSRLELRSALEAALRHEEFALEYQPVVSLDQGDVVGYEALLRWDDPQRGRRSPGEFIGVAESSGLIVPIGDWVLATAIATAARWQHAGARHVAVNVSARQFLEPDFVGSVGHALEKAGLPPQRLVLEITESMLVGDDHMWDLLRDLRRLGIQIAIDDFGTGYSALSYLRQMPLDIIKIDRRFISTTPNSPQQRAVLEGIVGLAHTLGLLVVAEGIETRPERDIATQAGCSYGQGFFFAPPIPEADLDFGPRSATVRTARSG